MLEAAQRELTAAGVDDTPEVVLADAGYWHGEQMQRIAERGIEVLIPPDTGRHRTTRRNWEGGRYDEMRQVLASERGGELYRRRQPMIEPVFGQMKFNRGLDRFRRRGRGAVRTEWRLITATHNLLKLHRHALAAARRSPRRSPPSQPRRAAFTLGGLRSLPRTSATASGESGSPPCDPTVRRVARIATPRA